jgi:hypothetical protein
VTRNFRPDRAQLPALIGRMRQGVAHSADLGSLTTLFYGGADPSQLQSLLSDENPRVLRDAAFILSELGGSGWPFKKEAERLLDHPDARVRYWALESLLASTGEGDEAVIAKCLLRLADEDDDVRYKAREFAARKRLPELNAGLTLLREAIASSPTTHPRLEEAARSPDAAVRAEALAAAAIIFRCDEAAAAEAAEADDELGELARQCRKVRSPARARR